MDLWGLDLLAQIRIFTKIMRMEEYETRHGCIVYGGEVLKYKKKID